jgi:Amt family ammonium transporter
MDFAGGTAVHITSGTTVAAFSIFYTLETNGFRHCLGRIRHILKKRVMLIFCLCSSSQRDHDSARQRGEEHELGAASSGGRELNVAPVTIETQGHETDTGRAASSLGPDENEPYSVNNIVLGTALLWIGWFGFNGGSALGGNLRAVSACLSTHVAACAGGSASLIIFWFTNRMARIYPGEGHDPDTYQKPSIILFCDGVVTALVAITPAAGYVCVQQKLTTQDMLTVAGSRLELLNLRPGILHLRPLGETGGTKFLEG